MINEITYKYTPKVGIDELEEIYNLLIVPENREIDSCPNKTVATYFDKKGEKHTLEFCCEKSANNKFLINRLTDENYWVTHRQFFIKHEL